MLADPDHKVEMTRLEFLIAIGHPHTEDAPKRNPALPPVLVCLLGSLPRPLSLIFLLIICACVCVCAGTMALAGGLTTGVFWTSCLISLGLSVLIRE